MLNMKNSNMERIDELKLFATELEGTIGTSPHSYDTIVDAFKKCDKTLIDKAVKWLEENVWEATGWDYSALTESFEEAMQN